MDATSRKNSEASSDGADGVVWSSDSRTFPVSCSSILKTLEDESVLESHHATPPFFEISGSRLVSPPFVLLHQVRTITRG